MAAPIRFSQVLAAIGFLTSTILGAGVLGLVGIARAEGGNGPSIVGWTAAALVALPLVFVFWRLSDLFPSIEGLAGYVRRAIGYRILLGLRLLLLITLLVVITLILHVGGAYLASASYLLFASPSLSGTSFGFLLLLASIAVCQLSSRHLGTFTTFSFLVLLFFLIAINVWNLPETSSRLGALIADAETWNLSSVARVCSLVFFAFMGWENCAYFLKGRSFSSSEKALVFGFTYAMVCSVYVMTAATVAVAASIGMASTDPASALLPLIERSLSSRFGFFSIAMILLANTASWIFSCSRLSRAVLGFEVAETRLWILLFFSLTGIYGLLEFHILPLAGSVLWVNQNLILAYALAIIAYATSARTRTAYAVSVLAGLPLFYLFLVSGTYGLFSIGFLGIGYLLPASATFLRSGPAK